MRDKIINFVKKKIPRPYFEITQKENSLVFKIINKIPLTNNLLIVKNRRTGKRISLNFKNSKATLKMDDLINVDELGIYDFYLKISLFNKTIFYRVNFNKQNLSKHIFDKRNRLYAVTFPTLHSNLSSLFYDSTFYPTIRLVEKYDNGITINGVIDIADYVEFDEVEIVAYSNKGGRLAFPCEFEGNNSRVYFKSNISVQFDKSDLDTSWKLKIRIKNRGIILNQSVLKAFELSNYKKHMDYLFFKFDYPEIDEIKPCLFYYSTIQYEFKFIITTQSKYESRVKSAKTKDLYEKYQKDPLENDLIFFESFHGRYNNNPKYIYEKMLEMGLDKEYKIVWSYDGDEPLPGNPITVTSDDEDYYKYLAHAKYKISNATFPIIDSRRGKVFLQTWHGTPLKRLGSDIDVKNPGIGWGHFNIEVPTWSYLVSANDFSTNTFRRAFSFNQEILQCGYPANDIFYTKTDEQILKIKRYLGIPADKKVILYAPTFRDDKKDENGERYFELELDLNYLCENIGEDYVLIIKTHYVISNALNISDELSDFVYDCSGYDDVHELFIISDILITDYSSVFFDFAHSKKPILFFTPDMESYIESRGVYHEVLQELPGPQLISNKGIVNAILNIESVSENYGERYFKFYNKYCSIGHGNAAEEIINKVFRG